MKHLLIALLLCVSISASAHASSKTPGSAPNPYSDCGIGAAIFPTVGWAAALSNAIWDLGTTALTSALSSPETCSARKAYTATLILETLPELEQNVAQGEGDYVVALAETMGCSSSSAIAASMRAPYAAVVSDAAYATQSDIQRATAMYNVARDAAIANSCGASL